MDREDKRKKSWISEFIFMLIIDLIMTLPIFLLFLIVGIRYALIASAIFLVLAHIRQLIRTFGQHKPPKSRLYRLPIMDADCIVTEKHTHVHPKTLWFREWILLKTTDGQQIVTYITTSHIGSDRKHLATFDVGDKGQVHYRKGKKVNYFEEFVPDGDIEIKGDE